MADEMVDRIVRQVLDALGRRGGAGGPSARLTDTVGSPAPAAGIIAAAQVATKKRAAVEPPRRLFVTAETLQQRLAADGGDGGVVELAANEFLTPAAADLAEQRHLTVRKQPNRLPRPAEAAPDGSPTGGTTVAARKAAAASNPSPTAPTAPGAQPANPGAAANPGTAAPAANPGTAAPAANPAPAALGLVIERADDKVASVLAALSYDGLAVVDYSQTDCWIANLRLLCEAIVSGSVCGGVAILPYAADAMVLANKVPGVRAVQGTRGDSVAAAIRHFAPNLLVIEHVFSTYHEMRAMVRLFAAEAGARPQAKVLMEALAELEEG